MSVVTSTIVKTLFPIGELTKPEVRAIAAKLDLVTADKKDSQGLCFIGKVRLPDFLQQQLQPKEGQIIEIPDSFEDYKTETPHLIPNKKNWCLESRKLKYAVTDGVAVGTHQGAIILPKVNERLGCWRHCRTSFCN